MKTEKLVYSFSRLRAIGASPGLFRASQVIESYAYAYVNRHVDFMLRLQVR